VWRDDTHTRRDHRYVVLNVVLAVVLLWLVAFAQTRPGSGQVRNE
jgi:hypothetical protein